MRQIFDQYDGPENRRTHALASSLAEHQKLLRRFARKFEERACLEESAGDNWSPRGRPVGLIW